MTCREALTKYIYSFVDELICNGLEHVVISPGSRSTPLAMTFVARQELKDWVIVDERSAGFFALGLAKKTQRPVVLVCTSGTAAANYFPAIVEAFHSDVPLLILTADRPHELRNVKAPQAIDQQKIYSEYVLAYEELALPDESQTMLNYVRQRASANYQSSLLQKGPIHMNIPLREPLLPDFSLNLTQLEQQDSVYTTELALRVPSSQTTQQVATLLRSKRKGLIVAGPSISKELAEAIVQLGKHYRVPILADPLSQVRNVEGAEAVVYTYDAILKSALIRKKLQAEYIIRFGQMPVSKMYRFYLEENEQFDYFIVSEKVHYADETRKQARFIHVDGVSFIHMLCTVYPQDVDEIGKDWFHLWMRLEDTTRSVLLEGTDQQLTEGSSVVHLNDLISEGVNVFVANSMAIRDFDTFFFGNHQVSLYANRGANGIDGVVSTAAGVGYCHKERTILFIGDLSFYHDMNGLLTMKQYQLNITIILINNDGGGIFSFLPQRETESFEQLFGTPLGLDFSYAAKMYGAHYEVVDTVDAYKKAIQASFKKDGLTLIEVQTNREENYHWHKDKWAKVNKCILNKGLIQIDETDNWRD